MLQGVLLCYNFKRQMTDSQSMLSLVICQGEDLLILVCQYLIVFYLSFCCSVPSIHQAAWFSGTQSVLCKEEQYAQLG